MEDRFDSLMLSETKKDKAASLNINLLTKISTGFNIMKYYGYLDQAYELGKLLITHTNRNDDVQSNS